MSAQADWMAAPDDDDETLAAFLDWSSLDADFATSGEFAKWVAEDNGNDAIPSSLVPSRKSDLSSSICGWEPSSLDEPCRHQANVVGEQILHSAAAEPDYTNGVDRKASCVSLGASAGWVLQQPHGSAGFIRPANSGLSTSDPFLYEEPLRMDGTYLMRQPSASVVKTSPFQQGLATARMDSPPCSMPSSASTAIHTPEVPLSEDLRRHVQLQVVKLLETEFDHAQVAWLQELHSMALTSPLPLLQTLSHQLDVLLMPLPEAPASVAAPAPATSAVHTSPFVGGAWVAPSACEYGDAHAEQQFVVACGASKELLVSSLQASPQCSDGLGAVPCSDYTPRAGIVSPSNWQCVPSGGQVWGRPDDFEGQQSQPPASSTQEHCSSEVYELQSLSGLKRGRARPLGPVGEVYDMSRSTRVKAEPSVSLATGMTSSAASGEQRWWRKQNNFTIAIDEIVKKMRSGEACLDVPLVVPQLFSLSSGMPDIDLDVDGPSICADRVRQVYDKPIKEAAKQLGVSVMSLKRTCRKMGVRRWPFRKLASLSELEATVREDQLEQQLQPSDKQAVMQYIEAEKARIMVEPDREVDPMLHNLRKAKIHMKYEKWGRKSLGRGKAAASKAVAMDAFLFDDDMMDGLL